MKARAVVLVGLLTFSIGLFLGTKMITPTQLSLEEEILAQEVRLKGVQRVLRYMEKRLTELKKQQFALEPQLSDLNREKAVLEEQVGALKQENEQLQAQLAQLRGDTLDRGAASPSDTADLAARVQAIESALKELRAEVAGRAGSPAPEQEKAAREEGGPPQD